MNLTSTVMKPEKEIATVYTCDGDDISPSLEWSELPSGTESLSLICDDPDAPVGTWVHWVMYNILADQPGLSDNVPTDPELKGGIMQGVNDFGRTGYGGPCPPGGTHRYFFKLYALDTTIKAQKNMNKQQLLEAMEGHILDKGELMVTYSR